MPIEIKNLSIKIKVENSHQASKQTSDKEKAVSKSQVIDVIQEINKAKKER